MLVWMDTSVRSRKHWSTRPSRFDCKLRLVCFEAMDSIISLAAILIIHIIVPVYALKFSLVFISQVPS